MLFSLPFQSLAGGLELLISNLNRLKDSDASEDKDGAYATLSVIENFINVEPSVASRLCDTSKSDASLVPFLLERLSSRTFDDTKLYASELLAILLQTEPEKHGKALGSSTFPIAARGGGTRLVDGIEYLCECINMYKKHSPELPEEQECLQNLFSCLCTLLVRLHYTCPAQHNGE
jgi:beta-catenin-like protein 1